MTVQDDGFENWSIAYYPLKKNALVYLCTRQLRVGYLTTDVTFPVINQAVISRMTHQ